jgi:hypothetical protein
MVMEFQKDALLNEIALWLDIPCSKQDEELRSVFLLIRDVQTFLKELP